MIAAIFATEIGRASLVGLGAFLAGFFYCWTNVPEVDIPAIQRNAEAGRDAVWEAKLRDKEREHEAELAAAIEARDSTPDLPPTDAELAELCERSSTCRDKGRKRQ